MLTMNVTDLGLKSDVGPRVERTINGTSETVSTEMVTRDIKGSTDTLDLH